MGHFKCFAHHTDNHISPSQLCHYTALPPSLSPLHLILFTPFSCSFYSILQHFHFPPQPASQIRDIQPGVRTATHKILTACREFCVATFLFIFNSVSTSRGTVICVCSSVLIPGLYKAMFTSYLST